MEPLSTSGRLNEINLRWFAVSFITSWASTTRYYVFQHCHLQICYFFVSCHSQNFSPYFLNISFRLISLNANKIKSCRNHSEISLSLHKKRRFRGTSFHKRKTQLYQSQAVCCKFNYKLGKYYKVLHFPSMSPSYLLRFLNFSLHFFNITFLLISLNSNKIIFERSDSCNLRFLAPSLIHFS